MPATDCCSAEPVETLAAASPPTPVSHGRRSWLRDFLVLAVLSGVWFCGLLGMRPLSNPDEGRYTEIPREMAASGDYVTPRLNGVKYFEKPPLVYWLSALTFRQFGVNEFTARLWNGLFAVMGVLMTYGTARSLYGRGAGIWAAIVLATTLMYYAMSQIVLLDMAVSVTVSGALFAFILAMREPRGRKRLGWFLVLYGCMGLATLSKGLIGIALPGAVIFLWLLALNRWRALWPFYPLIGTLLLLAIAVPWHVLAARANPDFLRFYFIHEHLERFTTRVHNRYQHGWFFVPVLIAGLFPWVFFAGRAVAGGGGKPGLPDRLGVHGHGAGVCGRHRRGARTQRPIRAVRLAAGLAAYLGGDDAGRRGHGIPWLAPQASAAHHRRGRIYRGGFPPHRQHRRPSLRQILLQKNRHDPQAHVESRRPCLQRQL